MYSNSLYQEVILDHNRKPRNYGKLDHASHQAVGHNPLCGDRLDITLQLEADQINHIAFQGESCAICKASLALRVSATLPDVEDKSIERDNDNAEAGSLVPFEPGVLTASST